MQVRNKEQVHNTEQVKDMFHDLLDIMRFTAPVSSRDEADKLRDKQAHAFYEKWSSSQPTFVDYFRKEWGPKLGKHALGGLNTCSDPR